MAPLVGFPGLNLTGCSVKLAQQNYGEYNRVIKAIAETSKLDVVFPLMDLAVEANALGQYAVFPQIESTTVLKTESSIHELVNKPRVNIVFDGEFSAT